MWLGLRYPLSKGEICESRRNPGVACKPMILRPGSQLGGGLDESNRNLFRYVNNAASADVSGRRNVRVVQSLRHLTKVKEFVK